MINSTPYYAVIFTSQRSATDSDAYENMAERMVALAKQQSGFLGVESMRGVDGFGITISYWKSTDDIRAWKANSEHQIAQEFGRSDWYSTYHTRICLVEREYTFDEGKRK